MDSENLKYKTTPLRSEASASSTRRKCVGKSSVGVYRAKVELNSTALMSGNIIESMPLYSPPKKVQNVRNPFEQAWLLKERLSQPVCSPSMFQKHISPIHKNSTFSWTVDDISNFCPAPIDECPSQEFTSWFSPDTESQAQDAIDRFFTSLSQGTLESPIVTKSTAQTAHVSCQTKLTFPPFLPKEIEAQLEALSQRCAAPLDVSMNSSTCSARRKILGSHLDNFSSGDESDTTVSEPDMSILPQYAATPLRRPMSSPEDSPIRLTAGSPTSPVSRYDCEEDQDCHMSVCVASDSPSR